MELIDSIIYVAEIIGTIAFALSGAMVGIEKRFDIFGVIVLAISTAVGGGAIRDVLLGRTPPNMFIQPIYAGLAVVSAIAVFCLTYATKYFLKYQKLYLFLVDLFDTIGLGVFAVTSANLVLTMYPEANVFLVVFMGTVTGAGGGILRDMMAGRVSAVLRKRIYAVAAIVGSGMYYYLSSTSLNTSISMVVSILSVITIRTLAAHYGWNLPRPSEEYFKILEINVEGHLHDKIVEVKESVVVHSEAEPEEKEEIEEAVEQTTINE